MQLGCGHVAIWCYVQRRCRAHEQQGPLHKKSHRALVCARRDAKRARKKAESRRKKEACARVEIKRLGQHELVTDGTCLEKGGSCLHMHAAYAGAKVPLPTVYFE